jgi:hypothetical protein
MVTRQTGNSTDVCAATESDAVRRSPRQTLLGVFLLGMSLLWLAMFTISLWSFPREVGGSSAPEVDVIASYLPEGKSRLGLTTPDGELHRYSCDPLARFCRFVKERSPAALKVRTVGPSSGLSDSAVLSARAGDSILVSNLEGQENLASLKGTYFGGMAASIVGLLLGILQLRPRRA